MVEFPCIQCGACCRFIGNLPFWWLEQWGLTADDNGHCVYLKNNMCSIYDTRPAVCRISEVIKLQELEEEDIPARLQLTADWCNMLIAREGGTTFVTLEPK